MIYNANVVDNKTCFSARAEALLNDSNRTVSWYTTMRRRSYRLLLLNGDCSRMKQRIQRHLGTAASRTTAGWPLCRQLGWWQFLYYDQRWALFQPRKPSLELAAVTLATF